MCNICINFCMHFHYKLFHQYTYIPLAIHYCKIQVINFILSGSVLMYESKGGASSCGNHKGDGAAVIVLQ